MLRRYSIHMILVTIGGLLTYVAYEEVLSLYILSVLMFMGVNVILSTSLNPRSKSHTLALRAEEHLEAEGAGTVVVELGELDLPSCGAPGSFDHARAMQLTERIRRRP